MLLQAQDLIKAGQATEAGGLLERLADRSDLSPIQTFQLAALLGQAQRHKRAIQVFRFLPDGYPDPYSRGYGLALAYFADGQYLMCIKSLKELETLEKVTEKIDKISVFGGLDAVLKDLVKIR